MAIEEAVEIIADVLPSEILSKVDFLIVLIETLGGLIIIYLVITILRFFMTRKQNKIIEEIRKDIKLIKKKIKK